MKNKKILIIDDQEDIVEFLSEMIELDFEELVVDSCLDVEEALSKISENDYKLICTDLNMPVMNGVDIIKRVRGEKGKNQNVPFVLITGDDTYNQAESIKHLSDVEILNKTECVPKLIDIVAEKISS